MNSFDAVNEHGDFGLLAQQGWWNKVKQQVGNTNVLVALTKRI